MTLEDEIEELRGALQAILRRSEPIATGGVQRLVRDREKVRQIAWAALQKANPVGEPRENSHDPAAK